jgi:hypothetical protein
MPANVENAFARGVKALFSDTTPVKPSEPSNVFALWNSLASKFPQLYEFAPVSKKAKGTEEKLMYFYKLDPRSEVDRGALAYLFLNRLESETANTLEGALSNWWEEISK